MQRTSSWFLVTWAFACGGSTPEATEGTSNGGSSDGAGPTDTGVVAPTETAEVGSSGDEGAGETATGALSTSGTTTGESSGESAAGESAGDESSGGESSSGDESTGGGLSGTEFRVLQLNLCHSGVAGCFTGDEAMTKAVEVIAAVGPKLVTLNEMCRADLPWLAAMTGAVDHRFTPALKADDTPVKCKNGDDYGIGLLSWVEPVWEAAVHGVYAAQSSMTERRVWICMGYAGFTGCTTHLSTNGATALAQCVDVVGGPLATAAANGPALLAGDWNLKYKGNPDAQDCVPGGFYRKGDGAVQHVLASDDWAFLETVVIDMDGATDHPGLEVRLTFP